MESSAIRQASSATQPALRLVRDAAELLPDPLSSFIGRETELREVGRLLEGTRLLSLTGAGGSGKTRLAIESARRAHGRFADGVCWVELAPLDDPTLVAAAILDALGERVHTGRTSTTQLTATLAERELLLVLDNCEHLVAECARLVGTILRGSPRLRVLATSREALGVPGEAVWPVPTLPSETAVRLFDDRARAVSPSFELTVENAAAVGEICRRLDGLPLAIELAAARITVLTPAQIAARLDDCFRVLGGTRRTALPRQQTLRATIDWSYALLAPAERELLARLSVFAGGCTLAAAEAVCAGGEIGAADVLTHLASLVDRSLVLAEVAGLETRYRLLETVRQYAAERLEASGSADIVRRRHVEHFVGAAEARAADRFIAMRDAVASPVRTDLDNIRVAMRWSTEHDADLFVRLAFGLGWAYFAWGLWAEGCDWLERGLALPLGSRRDAARARALGDLAYMVNHQLDTARARRALEEAMAIWEEMGNPRERAHAEQVLAQTYLFEGTEPSIEKSLRISSDAERALRAAGDWRGVCWARATQGSVHAAQRHPELSMAAYDEARQIAYQVGEPMTAAIGCMGMASNAVAAGDLPRASALLREGLAAHRLSPEYMFLAWTIECTAIYAAASGGLVEATRLLGADQMLRRHGGALISIETTQPETYAAIVGAARAALGDDAFEATLDEGRRLDVERTIALAESVVAPAAADRPADTVPAVRGPALRVVSLGPVRIERSGTPVQLAEWKYAKARELLFLLLLYPGGRTREQIGLALWPEASTEQLRSNLHPVLHHLRRVLGGTDWIVHEDGVYRFDQTKDYRFDAEEMDARISAAAAARGDHEAVATALAEAVALYDGDFLEQDPPAGDWHIDRQGALRRRYLDALATLGATYMALERWREAEETWRALIARDNLNEAAYRNLMRCAEQLGDRREAIRVYERLVAVLLQELDADPAPETVAVIESIQGGAFGAAGRL